MKLIEGMNYRQWQTRNTQEFSSINPEKQKEARQKGYYNCGWNKVQKSWHIISNIADNVVSLFEYQLSQGQINKAIDLAILEAEQGKRELEEHQQYLDKLAKETLAKYPLL